MNLGGVIGGLMILFVLLIGGTFGIILIANGMGTTPTTDSYGRSVTNQTNNTQLAITEATPVASTAGIYIAFIVGILVVASIIIFLANCLNMPHGRSRY